MKQDIDPEFLRLIRDQKYQKPNNLINNQPPPLLNDLDRDILKMIIKNLNKDKID